MSAPIAHRPSPLSLVCPDCGASSDLFSILERPAIFGFLECPACEIGSPVRAWRPAPSPWRDLYLRARALDDLSPASRAIEERALSATAAALDAI